MGKVLWSSTQKEIWRTILPDSAPICHRACGPRSGRSSHLTRAAPPRSIHSSCRARTDLHTYRARRATKVSHFRNILFSAWGESEQGINGRPQLAKISDLYLNTLAECGLTVPDVQCFFDVASPVYQAIVDHAPDLLTQLELTALAGLRPKEREELIASTKNRFLGFLQNPIVHTVLGNVHQDRLLDFTRLIREGAIVIVNLERGGVLRDEDVQIFANLFLHEILFAVYNTPQHERVPYLVFLDELPDFQSCAPLLIKALRHVRKYQLRFVCAPPGHTVFSRKNRGSVAPCTGGTVPRPLLLPPRRSC